MIVIRYFVRDARPNDDSDGRILCKGWFLFGVIPLVIAQENLYKGHDGQGII